MHLTAKLLISCSIATLIPTIAAAPTRQAIGPPGSSGDVYGSEEFLGPDGNAVDPADSAIVTKYNLVPGQTADANLGLYLDLKETENPQPVRGSNGGTDPGPRITKSCNLIETSCSRYCRQYGLREIKPRHLRSTR